VLIDRRTIRAHAPWLSCAAVLVVLAAAWFGMEWAWSDPRRMPGGSSRVGLCLGLAAGLIFLFEFLYWPRRFTQVRAWRIGRAETWLRAHVWLGLATLPLVLLHSGFSFGGPFTTLFMLLFLVVYASGLFGLLMQQVIPRKLLDETPEETIYSQIDAVMQQQVYEAERLVATATGNLDVFSEAESAPQYEEAALLIGSPREVGAIRERTRHPALEMGVIPYTEALCTSLESDIRPLLQGRVSRDSPLGTPAKSVEYFRELRRRVPEAAHDVVGDLEALCARHRQLQRQRRLHFWLHCWLAVHLPLSVALMILLLVHVLTSLQFSGIPFLAFATR
jgi:hypothetical protein